MTLTEYGQLDDALNSAFPARFEGSLGEIDFPSRYTFSLLDGAILRAVLSRSDFALTPENLAASINEMFELA